MIRDFHFIHHYRMRRRIGRATFKSMVYRWIGKAVASYVFANVKRRYGRQIGIGAVAGGVVAVAAVGVAVYLAGRDVPEG